MKTVIKFIRRVISYRKKQKHGRSFMPVYRVIEIFQNMDAHYMIKIQLINKNAHFDMFPKDILSDDNMINKFSSNDVRTITYLGYVELNSPKYKIIGQRIVDDGDTIFSFRKIGDKNIIVKSIKEIAKAQDIMSSLSLCDVHLIAFSMATADMQNERKQLESLNYKEISRL